MLLVTLACTDPETFFFKNLQLMRFLREHRSGKLRDMQHEMETIMRGAVSRNFDRGVATAEVMPSAEVAAVVARAKRVTCWRATESRSAQLQDALAVQEVRVMSGYRPRLLRAGTATSGIRSGMFDVLVQTGQGIDTEGVPIRERDVFW